MAGKTYSIKRNRIKDAVLEGFIPQGDSLVADESVYRNIVIFSNNKDNNYNLMNNYLLIKK